MLYVFVEGPDDSQFFEKIFASFLGELTVDYQTIEYASMSQIKLNNFIRTIGQLPDSDYLFFADDDGKGVETKRNDLLTRCTGLSSDKLFIVQFEIESWYYAGLSLDDHKKLKLKSYQRDTNTLTKEQFNAKLPSPRDRKYIMAQILSCYSKELAETRNNTFSIFYAKEKELAAV